MFFAPNTLGIGYYYTYIVFSHVNQELHAVKLRVLNERIEYVHVANCNRPRTSHGQACAAAWPEASNTFVFKYWHSYRVRPLLHIQTCKACPVDVRQFQWPQWGLQPCCFYLVYFYVLKIFLKKFKYFLF